MQSTPPRIKIVAGLFKASKKGFAKAVAEFKWTVRQNPEFWKDALLYCDRESWSHVRPHAAAFGEVVVDDSLPDYVRNHPVWNCKVWWAQKALERYERILYCDFDIAVLRPVDDALDQFLSRPPMFLYMPGFTKPDKQVCCGIVYYDRNIPEFEKFLELAYHKWHSDERAWTEVLAITREQLVTSGRSLTPHIVDHTWLLAAPPGQPEPYLIHGISCVDDGLYRMRRVGYGDRPYSVNLRERLHYWKCAFFRLKNGEK